MNESHNLQLCWEATAAGLIVKRKHRLGMYGGMVVAKRVPSGSEGGAPEGAGGRLPLQEAGGDPERVATIVGATSLHSQDRGLPQLLSGLRSLLDASPHLRILLNHYDSPTSRRPVELNTDVRITVSWVAAEAAADLPLAFWRRELGPGRLSGINYIWVFDGRLGVHQAHMPLNMLLRARDQLRAGLLVPPIAHHACVRACVSCACANQHRAAGSTSQDAYVLAEAAFEASRAGCSATTVATLPSLACAVFSGGAWSVFHDFLIQLEDGRRLPTWWAKHGVQWEPQGSEASQMARIVCAVLSTKFAVDPACVMLRSPPVTIFPALGLMRHATVTRHRARMDGSGGEVVQAFVANASAARHDDGRCWALTPVGWKGRGWRTTALGERARALLPKVHERHKRGA